MTQENFERAPTPGQSGSRCFVVGCVVAAVAVGCGGPPSTGTAADVPPPQIFRPLAYGVIHQGLINPLAGGNEANDEFGQAIVSGDFNHDTYPDLAISIVNEDHAGFNDNGAVVVLFSHPSVPTFPEYPFDEGIVLFRNDPGVTRPPGSTLASSDRFGFSLAVGDFNNDDFDDLVIGGPYVNTTYPAGWTDVGAVQVRYGALRDDDPLSTGREFTWGLNDGNHNGDRIGLAIATGNFNGDLYEDVAIGAPGTRSAGGSGFVSAGRVYVCYGSEWGINAPDLRYCHNFNSSPVVTPRAQQNFGSELAAGNFNGTEEEGGGAHDYDDLAIGAPGFYSAPPTGVIGQVFVRPGTSSGVTPSPDYYVIDAVVPSIDEYFGHALAAADLQHDGVDDLIIGAPDVTGGGGRIDIVAPPVASEAEEPVPWPVDEITESFTQDGLVRPDQPVDPPICVTCSFGHVLATGDFNGDGLEDIAAGVTDPMSTSGYVAVRFGAPLIYGFPTNPEGYVMVDQAFESANTVGDRFGNAIAAIDLFNQADGLGIDDLAIAAVWDDYGAPAVSNTGIVIFAEPAEYVSGSMSGVYEATSTYGGHTGTVRAMVSEIPLSAAWIRAWTVDGTFAFGAYGCHPDHDGGTATYEEGDEVIPGNNADSIDASSFQGSFHFEVDSNTDVYVYYSAQGTEWNAEDSRYDGLRVTFEEVRWYYVSGLIHREGTCATYGPTELDFTRVQESWGG